MRELGWTTRSPDLNFLPHYLFGFDTIGWAMHSPSAVPRLSPPLIPVSELLEDLEQHNEKILARVKTSGDDELDKASWTKTSDEFKSGSLKGPFYSLDDLPFPRNIIRLLLRFAIWEQHGGAIAPTCRNIDNGFQGRQNMSVGMQFTTRPADIDAIISLIRAVSEMFPGICL